MARENLLCHCKNNEEFPQGHERVCCPRNLSEFFDDTPEIPEYYERNFEYIQPRHDTDKSNLIMDLLGLTLLLIFKWVYLNPIETEWQNFKFAYDKTYVDFKQEDFRRQIFVNNYMKMKEHNDLYRKGLRTYSKQLNYFSDLSIDEINKIYYGFQSSCRNFNETDYDVIVEVFVPPVDVELPDEVDWRLKNAVTPVKDQKACGSCWAFSAIGTLEGQYAIKHGYQISFSEQNIVDCSLNDENSGCCGGYVFGALNYIIMNNGINSDDLYPYEALDNICRYSSFGNITTIRIIAEIDRHNEEHLKASVATIGPIAVAIHANNDFMSYSSGVFYEPDCKNRYKSLNHAVLVVGYGTENGTDFWLVKNSWSVRWGDNGYIKMARNKNNSCGIASRAIFPILY